MKATNTESRRGTARWSWPVQIATLVLVMGGTATSQAAVTSVAGWYQLGESDPGAAANTTGQNPTVDSSGNGFHLTRSGNPQYRADTGLYSGGSTLSMDFDGNDGYSRTAPVTTSFQNVGMEVWAKPEANPTGLGFAIYNGLGNGYGIEMTSAGNWEAFIGGVGTFPTSPPRPAILNQWQHLGLVLTPYAPNPALTDVDFYFNGTLTASLVLSVQAPTANFSMGSLGGGNFFNGLLDQGRVFTFAPGQFSVNDFIPEPSVSALLVMGGALVFWRRRRR